MLRQANASPRGPRGTTRGAGRGGIQKRRAGGAPVKVDKDGDLVMDPTTIGDKRRAGRGGIDRASAKPLGDRRTNGGPRGGSSGIRRNQQSIMRGFDARQANIRESHVAAASSSLKIEGLSMSKAAGNPDGGLESLLGFLERKARNNDPSKSNRVIKIKKVCLSPAL